MTNVERHQRELKLMAQAYKKVTDYEATEAKKLPQYRRFYGNKTSDRFILDSELRYDQTYRDLVGAWRDHKDLADTYGIAAMVELLTQQPTRR